MRRAIGTALDRAASDSDPYLASWAKVLLVVGPVVFLSAYLLVLWGEGRSVSLAVAGYYQISDASWYWPCANGLVEAGAFPGPIREWCQNRPLYAALLASISAVTGRYLPATLLLQAAMVGLACAAYGRQLASVAGLTGAVLGVAVLLLFATRHTLPLTMTENAGLLWGAVGFAILLHAASRDDPYTLFFGTAAISIALNARAGAFLVLPLIIVWAALRARRMRQPIVFSVALVGAAAAVGFALQGGVVGVTGGDAARSHGNFSYVLYGLSVGGKNWQQITLDHPELFQQFLGYESELVQRIYALAIENITRNPARFGLALMRNVRTYFEQMFSYMGAAAWCEALRALWVLGIVAIIARFRDARGSLVGFMSLGCLLSGPLIAQDGGARIFAATIPVDAAQASLGLSWLVRLLNLRGKRGNERDSRPGQAGVSKPVLAFSLAAILLAATLAPLTPIRQLFALKSVAAAACPQGLDAVVAHLGRETYFVSIDSGDAPLDIRRMKASADQLGRGLPRDAWYHDDFAELKTGTLVNAYQRSAGDTWNFGSPNPIIWHGDLAPLFERTVRFCLLPKSELRSIGGSSYRIAASVDLLESPD